MRFTELALPGVWLIEPEPHRDERGVFRRHFCVEEFVAHGIDPRVSQCNVSENVRKGTLRGFHYQEHPYWEAKTLSCFSGIASFVVVDLRPGPTYLKSVRATLTRGQGNSLHVPAGCAPCFMTLETNTLLHYYCSAPYVPSAERGIRWNDPALGIKWLCKPEVISEKDRSWPAFIAQR